MVCFLFYFVQSTTPTAADIRTLQSITKLDIEIPNNSRIYIQIEKYTYQIYFYKET